MSPRSPALCRSACGHDFKPSQATFCSTMRKVLQAGINAEDIHFGDSYSGFRGNRICAPLRKKHTTISCIRWTYPPKFIVSGDWHLAAGDQSEETRVQEHRETVVTEVIYPHPSAIPSSPSISSDVEEGHRDDGHDPPIIPITPIEDDEADSSHKVEPFPSVKENVNVEVLDQGVPAPKLEADIGAAASAAFTALVKSNEQGSLIDTDLLIKILSDPKMIELLKATVPHEVKQESSLDNNLLGNHLSNKILEMLMSNTAIPSVPPPCSVPDTMLLKQVCRYEDKLLKQSQTVSDLLEFISSAMLVPKSERASVAMSTRIPIIPLQEDPGNRYLSTMAAGKTTQSILDANYYKSLVRQHGVERQELQVQKHNPGQFGNRLILREPGNVSAYLHKQGNGKSKASFPKLCMYFNNPKGCRLGLSCPFTHELSSPQMRARSVSEAPGGKRVRLNREFHQR